MTDQEIDAKAVAAAKAEKPEATNVRVTGTTDPFLGGVLATVTYRIGEQSNDSDYYIHLVDGQRAQIIYDMQEMSRAASLWEKRASPPGWWRLILSNVPAIIALLLTGAVIWIVVYQGKAVDETLKLSLGSVIAFFFGTQVKKPD